MVTHSPDGTTPLVQIIIPTYNRPSMFKEALLSVLAQTYQNIRISITDNSDNNATAELICPFLELDPRISYEHHPDYNEQDNWNRGMEMTDPDAVYINWLMDDDLFFPTKLADMVSVFQSHEGLSIVTSSRLHIDSTGNPVTGLGSPNLPVKQDTRFTGSEAGRGMLKGLCNYVGEPTTALVKRDCLLDGYRLGWTGNEGRYFLSDIPTWLRLLEQGDLFFIKNALSAFRLHENQVGKRLSFLISLQGTWAYVIHHAILTGTYLVQEDDIREALTAWLKEASSVLRQADLTGYRSEDVNALRLIYDEMKKAHQNPDHIHAFTVYT